MPSQRRWSESKGCRCRRQFQSQVKLKVFVQWPLLTRCFSSFLTSSLPFLFRLFSKFFSFARAALLGRFASQDQLCCVVVDMRANSSTGSQLQGKPHKGGCVQWDATLQVVREHSQLDLCPRIWIRIPRFRCLIHSFTNAFDYQNRIFYLFSSPDCQ